MKYDVIIVGAGLAGSSAAIQLARMGWKVLLLEQQRYPIHRLCGEFLSIEVMNLFTRLGILDQIRDVGAHLIDRTVLTTSMGASFQHPLPSPALGLSRYQLDLLLFQNAVQAGVTCHDGTPVQGIEGNFEQGFRVQTPADSFQGRVVLGAFGKRSNLDRKLDRTFVQNRSPWIAFKAHCQGLQMPGTIEMHSFPGGYCGLSMIETNAVNLCWIGHQNILLDNGDRRLPPVLSKNPALHDRLQHLEIDPASRSQLSQISFAIKGNFMGDICMIGDAAGMITPLCGDGMAMALRTAEIVAPLVSQMLDHHLSATEFKQQYQRHWQQEFRSRLRLGQWIHQAFVQPQIAQMSLSLCAQIPSLGDWFIRRTRGTA